MFSSLRKRLEDSLDAVEALANNQPNPRGSLDMHSSSGNTATPEPLPTRRPAGMTLEERLRMKLAAAGAASSNPGDAPPSPSTTSTQGIPSRRTATPPPGNRNPASASQSPARRPIEGTPPLKKSPLPLLDDTPPPPPPKNYSTGSPFVDPLQVALPLSPDIGTPLQLSAQYSSFQLPSPLPALSTPETTEPLLAPAARLSISDDSDKDGDPSKEDPPSDDQSSEQPAQRPPTPPLLVEEGVPAGEESHSAEPSDKITQLPSPDEPEEPTKGLVPTATENLPVLSTRTPRASISEEAPIPLEPTASGADELEKLRERLKLVEQRFSDVSKSFKRLQAEKVAADRVLKEYTALDSIADAESLREHLRNLGMKNEMSLQEIKRLNGQISQHDARLEDLRDTHRLESRSQSEQIDVLKKQVSEAEALLMASSSTTSNIEATSAARQATIDNLNAELEKAKAIAKDEEEKRTKAIALLKTLRQKLLQAEKAKDDLQREHADAKSDVEVLKIEIGNGRAEVERVRSEKEREVATLKLQFERELAGAKERYEKDAAAKKAQFELEAITTKASHTKDITTKNNRISQLESSIRSLTSEKDGLFDQLQMRQAELESSQYQLEALTNENKDLQFRLREATEKLSQIPEDSSSHHRGHIRTPSTTPYPHGSSPAPAELARLLSETEGKYEARLSEMRTKMRSLEKERTEAEEEWSKNLGERTRELEKLRHALKERDEQMKAAQVRKSRDDDYEEKERELQAALQKAELAKTQLAAELGLVKSEVSRSKDNEASLTEEKTDAQNRMAALEKQLEELRSRETQLKTSNKTLREELRKVQSSAALLEKQRNPGVGYWSNSPRTPLDRPTSPLPKSNGTSSVPSSPRSATPGNGSEVAAPAGSGNNEEEVNLEYLRNVILQFLEHKEMRPNLVRVLSIILHFTPQETRRLIAKV